MSHMFGFIKKCIFIHISEGELFAAAASKSQ